ncbi:MAG: ABC transporter ATP-binding protein [Bacteriovoracaceae bacterium]|jgi:sodium transport system ATP-binding protein|nr:ABC transporter ATP-binding protein [Bacteriovoracaceae bacterium]
MSAITIKNLSKKFQDTVAVDDISFEIPFGEVTALLGSNGAGKSTTLNMIAGILLPTSGTIEFSGKTFEKNYKEVKTNLGYLTCDMALYETFSVLETLRLLGDLKGFSQKKTNDRIEQLAEQFSLGEILEKHYSELSSGQKQRSLISASIIHDPEILIFDEVTASLDLVVSKDIMDFLKAEKERGKAIIFSTHILSEVEYLSDRILMIEKGILVKETNHQELLESSNSTNLTEAFYKALKEEQVAA